MSEKREVTEVEFKAHISAWPRPLALDVFGAFEPPLVTYNDFTLGAWPASVVASHKKGVRYRDLRDRTMDDPPAYVEEASGGWRIHRELP